MKKISKLLTLALIAGVGIFGSCKDVNEDMFQDMTQKSQNADSRIAVLEKALTDATAQLVAYKTSMEQQLALALSQKADITTLDEYAKKIAVDELNERISRLEFASPGDVAELAAIVNETMGELEALKSIVATLSADNTALNAAYQTLNAAYKEAGEDALAAYILAQKDSANIEDALLRTQENADNIERALLLAQQAYDLAEAAHTGTADDAMNLAQKAFDLATANKEYSSTVEKFIKDFNKNYKKFFDRQLPKIESQLAEIEDKVFLFDFQMENLVKPAIEDFRALEIDFADVKSRVETLEQQVSDLINYRDHQITGIINQGTFNRLFGYVSTPFGNNSLLLALYSNSLVAGGEEFPMELAAYEKNEEGMLSAGDVQILKDGGMQSEIMPEDPLALDASAGKLYFTVNPVEANLEGTEFSLVNSKGEETFLLKNIVPATRILHYGADFTTRATIDEAAENGLYEADVILPAESINDNVLHLSELVDTYKDVLSQPSISASDIKNLRSTTSSFLLNRVAMQFETNAIKALWSDNYGNHTVYSPYEFGIAALNPLSYGAFEGRTFSIAQFLQRINFADQMERLTSFNTSFDFGSVDYYSTNDEVRDLIAAINDALVDASDSLSYQVETQLGDKVGKLINKIMNSRFIQYDFNLNAQLLPVLFYANAEGEMHTLGTTPEEATLVQMSEIEGAQVVKLVGSSLTAEVLAPAYKKFIGVTNVYNADMSANALMAGQFALKAAALDANRPAGFNEVVDGSDVVFDFYVPSRNEAQRGYIYEITYSAMDYSGYTITNKYYIRLQ